jgi:hypothetical protein
MDKTLLKDALGWGFILWLIGYVLGIALFFILPPSLIGWAITPIGVAIAIWVLLKRKGITLNYYLALAVVWTVLAVILDYLLVVKLFKPADGYYKPDVYLYYLSTFLLPLLVFGWKAKRKG